VKYIDVQKEFPVFYSMVKSSTGGVFGLGNITVTELRKKDVKFSPPFISNINVLMTHNSVPVLTSMAAIKNDFKGFSAYNVRGTSNEKHILALKDKYIPELPMTEFNTSDEVLEKVSTDKASFTYLDFIHYTNALKNGLPVKRHEVGDKMVEKYALIMPLNSDWSTLLEEYFNKGGGLINQTDYKKLIFKHLGPTVYKLMNEAKTRQDKLQQ